MKKKELLALPYAKITPTIVNIVSDSEVKTIKIPRGEIQVPKFKSFYRAKRQKKNLLEVDIYTRNSIIDNQNKPVYRVFLYEDKYYTYETCSKKWRTATIENIHCDNVLYYDETRTPYIQEKDKKIILDFCDNKTGEPRAAIQKWQTGKKHKKEIDYIDSQMAIVPDLPKGFDDWIVQEASQHFLFYDAGSRAQEGYCTRCKKTIKIENPKYNKIDKCPICKKEIIYKSRTKSGNLRTTNYASLWQKTSEGFVWRYFEIIHQYINGELAEAYYTENLRTNYDDEMGQEKEFEWDRFKNGNYRWCNRKKTGYYYLGKNQYRSLVYTKNLKRVFKGTPFEYCGFKEFLGIDKVSAYQMDQEYFDAYRNYPVLESLIKCRFFNIAKRIVGNKYGYENTRRLKRGDVSIKKCLGVSTEYYKMLLGTNPTYEEYAITHQLSEYAVRATRQQITLLAKEDAGCLIKYIPDTTIHKMIRYIVENLQGIREKIIIYRDTLEMAIELGYDVKNEFILYPKNVSKRHDQYVEEKEQRKAEVDKADDLKKDSNYHKLIQSRGLKRLEMQDKEFSLILPKSLHDIRLEGVELHHCVATYINAVYKGKTSILFLRKKSKIEEPYYTVEVKDNEVIQVRGRYNKDATKKINKFIEKYKKKLKEPLLERKAS